MDYKKLARSLYDYSLNKMYEIAVEKMVERGYEARNVKMIGGEIVLDVDDSEKTGMELVYVKADSLEELVEQKIDGEIDRPKYAYDEGYEDRRQSQLPPTYADQAIPPGSRVSIDGLKDWIIETKANSDPVLQAAIAADYLSPRIRNKNHPDYKDQEWTSDLDRAVDRIAYKVARKIYYVGRKPANMTPEEWDIFIEGKKPLPGSYSKNETWGDREFPYGNQYSYREGPLDDVFFGGTADPIYKGWTKAGYEGKRKVV